MIFLRDVTHKILVAIMDFMYQGEVSIGQDSLAAFLAVGKDLKIQGLTEGKKAEDQVEHAVDQAVEEVKKVGGMSTDDTRNIKEVFNWNIKENFPAKLKSKEKPKMVEGDTSSDQEKPIQGLEGQAPRGSGEKSPRKWLARFIA